MSHAAILPILVGLLLAPAPAADADRVLRSAEDLIAAGRPEEAAGILDKLAESRPEDERVFFLLAQCEWNLWRADRAKAAHLEKARSHLEKARVLKAPYPACSFVSGLLEMDAKDYAAAVRGFREALAAGYEPRVTRENLALALFHHGLDTAAAAEKDIDRLPTAILVFEEARDRFRALAEDTRLLPAEREDFRDYWLRSWSNLAALHVRGRSFLLAEKMLAELIALEPGNPFHRQNLGRLHEERREWEAAVRNYEKALDLGREIDYLLPRLGLGRVYSAMEKFAEAEAQFAAYLARHPESLEGHLARGIHYLKSHEYDKAEADFRKCLAIDPAGHVAMKALSDALRGLGRTSEAEEWAEKYRKADAEATRETHPK